MISAHKLKAGHRIEVYRASDNVRLRLWWWDGLYFMTAHDGPTLVVEVISPQIGPARNQFTWVLWQ